MHIPTYALIWSVWLVTVVAAVFLTIHFNREDAPGRKVIKFFGVLVSTMPFLGLLQGLAVRLKIPGYAQDCLGQVGVGMVAFAIIQTLLK